MTSSLYSIILPGKEAAAALRSPLHFSNEEGKLSVKALMEAEQTGNDKLYQYSSREAHAVCFAQHEVRICQVIMSE